MAALFVIHFLQSNEEPLSVECNAFSGIQIFNGHVQPGDAILNILGSRTTERAGEYDYDICRLIG